MGGLILTGELMYRHPRGQGWGGAPPAEWPWRKHPPTPERLAMIGVLERIGQTDPTVRTFAHVNHGRWVVECPFCGSSQVAMATDHRFLCAGANACANSAVGGAFIEVAWPSDDAREAIEELLLRVREIPMRNWEIHETVDDLAAQVELHLKASG